MPVIPSQLKRKRYLALIGGVAVLAVALVLGVLSPVAALSQIEVEGLSGKQAEKVRQVANLEPGTPLVQINENEIAARVQDVPNIASVRVSKSWPNTVIIKVVERKPVAKVEIGPQEWEIVDATGQAFRTTKKMPKLPTLQAEIAPPFTGKGRVAGAQVLASLPKWLAKRVTTAKANDPQTVKLLTDDNETIVWGTPEDAELKADVLRILLKQKGMYWFDVRNPELPTVSQAEPRPALPPKDKDPEADESSDAGEGESAEPSATSATPGSGAAASSGSTPSPNSNNSRRPGTAYLLP